MIKSILQYPDLFHEPFLPSFLQDEIQSLNNINEFWWGGSTLSRRGIRWLS